MIEVKFRKKTIVIEAEQWFPEKEIEGIKVRSPTCNPFGEIETLEGTMFVSVGDWIITDINGEKYPCKPDIFEKTYERVIGA